MVIDRISVATKKAVTDIQTCLSVGQVSALELFDERGPRNPEQMGGARSVVARGEEGLANGVLLGRF